MKVLSRTRAVGGSLVITVPIEIVKSEDLRENELVEVEVKKHKKDCDKRKNIHDLMTPHADTPYGRTFSGNGKIELAYLRGLQQSTDDVSCNRIRKNKERRKKL